MITRYTLLPPIIKQPGDEMIRKGKTVEQWRNGQLIATAYLVEAIEVTELLSFGGERIDTLFLETAMIGQTVSMTSIRENTETGKIIVDFSSGNQYEIDSWEAVGERASNIDSSPEFAENLLLGMAWRLSTDGTNKTTQVGASVSCNLLASVPIVYTPAE